MPASWSRIVVASALVVVACAKSDRPASKSDSSAVMDSTAGMPGMAATGSTASREMEAHLDAMKGRTAEGLKAELAAHRQMTANLIASYNREMRDMNMAADAAWSATVDSLRSDLRIMPDLGASQLQAMMPAHQGRIARLMQMHQSMMKAMKM